MELCKIKDAIKASLFKSNMSNLSIIQLMDVLSNDTILHLYNDLVTNQSRRIYIFTDGNCKNNGKKNARAAFCVFSKDCDLFNTLEEVDGKSTNNIAELNGFLHIYRTIYNNFMNTAEPVEFMICADSEYCINCVSKWLDGWSSNNWKKKDGKPVLNKDILVKIQEYRQKIYTNTSIKIKFKHIMSHMSEPVDKTSMEYYYWYGNNYVDKKINKYLIC